MESEEVVLNCTTEVEDPKKLQFLVLVDEVDTKDGVTLIESWGNEGDDVSAVGYPSSSTSDDFSMDPDTQRVFEVFESAMDEWYSKIAALGPLNDKEILKASFQLARNFNLDILADSDWLKRFKSRHGLSVSDNGLVVPRGIKVRKFASLGSDAQHTSATDDILPEPSVTGVHLQHCPAIGSYARQTAVVECSQQQPTVTGGISQQPDMTICSDQQIANEEKSVVINVPDSDDESVSPSLPRKRMKIESATGTTSENDEVTTFGNSANCCSDSAYFSDLITTLVNQYGKTPNEAENWASAFMKTLSSWIATESSSERLHLYQLRLKVANLAREMGQPTFTFTDEFFINIVENLPQHFVQRCRPNRKKWTPFSDEVVKWYDDNSRRRFVSAMELERKTVEIAKAMNLPRFRPSRESLQHLLDRYGLYCPINKRLNLFLKPSAGLLVHRFNAACETWYQEWPGVLDDVFVYECDFPPTVWTLLSNYLAVLTEWYVESSVPVSANTIAKKEVELAKEMQIGLEVYCDWYQKWCDKVTNAIKAIGTFNRNLVHNSVLAFKSHPSYLVKMRCVRFKNIAEEGAGKSGIKDFVFTKKWLKRFLWINKLENLANDSEIDDFFDGA